MLWVYSRALYMYSLIAHVEVRDWAHSIIVQRRNYRELVDLSRSASVAAHEVPDTYIRNLRRCETGGRKRRWKIAGTRRDRKREEDKAKKERGRRGIQYLRIQIKSPRADTYEKRNQSLNNAFRAILRGETRELNLFNTPFVPSAYDHCKPIPLIKKTFFF